MKILDPMELMKTNQPAHSRLAAMQLTSSIQPAASRLAQSRSTTTSCLMKADSKPARYSTTKKSRWRLAKCSTQKEFYSSPTRCSTKNVDSRLARYWTTKVHPSCKKLRSWRMLTATERNSTIQQRNAIANSKAKQRKMILIGRHSN